MSKVEVKIEGLSYAKTQVGTCIIILSQLNAGRKLPVIIDPSDGQYIAVKVNKINGVKPKTPDVFKMITDVYKLDIQEIVIYSIVDGVFYSKIVTSDSIETIEIECGVSTALAMAAVYECPIYVNSEVMESAGFDIDEAGNPIEVKPKKAAPLKNRIPLAKLPSVREVILTKESLSKLLDEAVEREDFEQAVILRDKIEKIKKI